ncbi:excalibur calcium-binding domain-containing protein [Noviluteimonas dokdonensis]|uniref:excalibur calcium-binding domain-containing protein n=1 Tax=Noviluteimonas dokdonensis TaxID=414050 RepID=UPI0031F32511
MGNKLLWTAAATFAVAFLLPGLNSNVAHAHSGGLNAEGCHHDRKHGGYHCHRGPGASAAPKARVVPRSDLNSGSVYYRNCSEARAAGAAPVRRGDPGYAPHLDRDNDGIGCE